jgi:uncharacterized protein (DUF433 family)
MEKMGISARVFRVEESEMTNRIPRVRGQSLQGYPIYSIPEAASILAMSRRTLQSWVYDRPYFPVSGSDQPQRLLSFRDLAQFYFLKFVREHANLSDGQARRLLQYTKKVTKSEYPLLSEDIRVLPRHVFLNKQNSFLELINPPGQFVFEEIVSIFASRVDRDKRGLMVRLYPWRLWKEGDARRPVSVDPNILSGRLVITGTRIPATVVAIRKKQGESVVDIARDYGISQQRVTESLRHLHIGIRKAA